MNKQIKRFLACVLIVSLSIISLTPVSAAKAFSGTVAPFYNNVASATATININSSGNLTIGYKYSGYSSVTTKAVITTYIEKKTLGLFWKRADGSIFCCFEKIITKICIVFNLFNGIPILLGYPQKHIADCVLSVVLAS